MLIEKHVSLGYPIVCISLVKYTDNYAREKRTDGSRRTLFSGVKWHLPNTCQNWFKFMLYCETPVNLALAG